MKYIPNECRLNIYQAFISSNFNYCDIVWHFCSNLSTYKIEMVHKNALRVTLNDYTSSYSDMLEVVKTPMLHISIIKNIAIEILKVLKDEFINIWDLFFRFQLCLTVHVVDPNYNNLPQGVKDTTCFIACTDLIVKWEGPTCKCGFCIMCNMSKI